MMKHFNAIIVIIFGAVVALGGAAGYATANSLASLITGVIAGFLLIICGVAMIKRSVLGFFAACLITAIMFLFFGNRFWLTGKFLPAGMLTIISLLIFILLVASKIKTENK